MAYGGDMRNCVLFLKQPGFRNRQMLPFILNSIMQPGHGGALQSSILQRRQCQAGNQKVCIREDWSSAIPETIPRPFNLWTSSSLACCTRPLCRLES